MSKQRNIRKRRALDDNDGDSEPIEDAKSVLTAQDIKLLQRQRQRKTVGITFMRAIRHLFLPPGLSWVYACHRPLLFCCILLLNRQLQGVNVTALATAATEDRQPHSFVGAEEDGVLQAAFKQERRQIVEDDNPEM